MLRAFIAINIPGEYLRPISVLLEELMSSNAAVRWVKPGSIHLTLKFLGNIKEEQVHEIANKVKTVVGKYTPFELRVEGCGAFPSVRNPRVIWLGVHGALETLKSLQSELEKVLIPLGFPPEKRSFRAHLTVGRVKGARGKKKLVTLLEEKTGFSLAPFMVRRVVFFKSDLKSTGAVYTPLEEIALK